MAIKRVVLCKDCPRSHKWGNDELLIYCDYWDVIVVKKMYCFNGAYFKRIKWQKRDFGYIQEGEPTNEN